MTNDKVQKLYSKNYTLFDGVSDIQGTNKSFTISIETSVIQLIMSSNNKQLFLQNKHTEQHVVHLVINKIVLSIQKRNFWGICLC